MDFLFQMQRAEKNKTVLQFTNNSEIWAVSAVHEFYDENELTPMAAKLVDYCWLIPTKVNQGCYDALQLLRSTSTLRVVQLTVAAKHSLKLRYVISVLKTLGLMGINITSLDVVVVVPPDVVTTFALGPVESDKNKAITDLNWDTSKCRVFGFKRAGL
jgi:hypothetical protein